MTVTSVAWPRSLFLVVMAATKIQNISSVYPQYMRYSLGTNGQTHSGASVINRVPSYPLLWNPKNKVSLVFAYKKKLRYNKALY